MSTHSGSIPVGDYSMAAEFYDLLYHGEKDYVAEADLLAATIRAVRPEATSLLDVGCGTGAHARALTDAGFRVDGVDLEPAFVERARVRCPEGDFRVGDMTSLDLPRRYDVVTCLFSAIGYVRTEQALRTAVRRMAAHLGDGGLLVVDPWFEPGELTDGWISTLVGRDEDVTVCRMSRTVVEGLVSRLEFEYLIGRSTGLERRSEVHELGLFRQDQMEDAFRAAGLSVERKPEALRTRGLYVGRADGARFYDDLADHYDLIFEDWEGAMRRQGAAIEAMLADAPTGPGGRVRVLDVAAGIGTQSLPLAARGYDVIARDLSEAAVARLSREAAARGLDIDAAPADMRRVADSVEGKFEAVIAFDNSVPHLLSDREISEALSRFRELLAPGGLLLISVRDYDQVDRAPTSRHPYGERRRDGRVFRVGQEWTWIDEARYRTTMLIEERRGGEWDEVVRTGAVYYAIPVPRLLELMEEAGFSSCGTVDVPFYQPVLAGRANHGGSAPGRGEDS